MRRSLALLLAGLLAVPPAGADDVEQRRVDTGVRLFRSLLAADLGLEGKAVEGQLIVVFVFKEDGKRADELARTFGRGEPIRGLRLVVETSRDPALASYAQRVPAGVFLVEAPNAAGLRAVVQYGIDHRVIVYSPFEGHVEKGVLGGLAVEAQVRPYINLATLTASQIVLKDFFMRATKVYR